MFVQILEVDEDRIPPDFVPVLLSRDMRSIDDALLKLKPESQGARAFFIDFETNLHESIHIVQAVIYPFLRWYSMLIFQQVADIFRELKDLGKLLNSGVVENFVIPSFLLLDVDYYIWDLSKRFLGWTYKSELGISLAEEAVANAKPLIPSPRNCDSWAIPRWRRVRFNMANPGGSSCRLRHHCARILMRHRFAVWQGRPKTGLRLAGF